MSNIVKEKLMKLAKMLTKFATIEIGDNTWTYEGEFIEGVEVYVEQNGEYVPVADGEYTIDDKTITVAEGKVVSIVEKEEEVIEEPEQLAEEPIQEPAQEPAQEDVEALKTRIVELEGLLQDRDAIVEQLTKENDELKAEIENLKNQPKEEPVNLSKTPKATFDGKTIDNPALKYFKN